MGSRLSKADTGMSVSFAVSAVIHLAVFLLLWWSGQLFPSHMPIQETYYVDVVDVPVADPSSGSAAQKAAYVAPLPLSPPVPAPSMAEPSHLKAVPKVPAKPVKSKAVQDSIATESDFAERMAKLERNTEARREEAVLEKLRNKVKNSSNSKVGAPGSGGAEAGSRYADYLKSRLEDALKETSSYTTKNPEVAVRLTISGDGKLAHVKIERSSGDRAFELAVRRAIDLASEKFTAPPNRAVFENGFIFKPKGISNGISR